MLIRAFRYLTWLITGLVTHPHLVAAMWRFERALPMRIEQPLPDLMNELTPRERDLAIPPVSVRRVADAIAALDLRSPLGFCLRRSLLRYHFFRRAGLDVAIQFGARFKETRDIGGHAWLTLEGQPYAEETENYAGFAVIYSYPQ